MALVNHAGAFPLTLAKFMSTALTTMSVFKDPTLLLHRQCTSVSHLQFLIHTNTICLSCFHFVLFQTQRLPARQSALVSVRRILTWFRLPLLFPSLGQLLAFYPGG